MISQEQLETFSKDYQTTTDLALKEFKFFGQELRKWTRDFTINIPKNPSFADIQDLYIELDELISVANNNMLYSYNMFCLCKRSLEEKQAYEYIKLTSDSSNKKTINSIENHILYNLKEENDIFVVSKYVYDFWVEILKMLERKQKLIENVSWNIKNSNGVL